MAEGKTNMFGKTYNTVGSTDSNFIIKTKGDLKIQWGNKYIDLIKNGKIVSGSSKLLYIVSSPKEIDSNGIYIVQSTEGNEVWINIDGNKINITNDSEGTAYVSFLVEQEATSEQKHRALTNIGFYYNTLQEAQAANIVSGIIYVEGDNKLYVAKNGTLTEYNSSFSITDKKETIEEEKQPLYIEQYQIRTSNIAYIECNNNIIHLLTPVQVYNMFQSNNANESKGYRLYIDDEGYSTLEIDYIKWRKYLIPLTYSELVSNMENKTLSPKMFYLITDFQNPWEVTWNTEPMYYENEYEEINGINQLCGVRNAMKLIVQAKNEELLEQQVWSLSNPEWIMYYDPYFRGEEHPEEEFTQYGFRYIVNEDGSTVYLPCKGQITYLKDELGNEGNFNFRQFRFKHNNVWRYIMDDSPESNVLGEFFKGTNNVFSIDSLDTYVQVFMFDPVTDTNGNILNYNLKEVDTNIQLSKGHNLCIYSTQVDNNLFKLPKSEETIYHDIFAILIGNKFINISKSITTISTSILNIENNTFDSLKNFLDIKTSCKNNTLIGFQEAVSIEGNNFDNNYLKDFTYSISNTNQFNNNVINKCAGKIINEGIISNNNITAIESDMTNSGTMDNNTIDIIAGNFNNKNIISNNTILTLFNLNNNNTIINNIIDEFINNKTQSDISNNIITKIENCEINGNIIENKFKCSVTNCIFNGVTQNNESYGNIENCELNIFTNNKIYKKLNVLKSQENINDCIFKYSITNLEALNVNACTFEYVDTLVLDHPVYYTTFHGYIGNVDRQLTQLDWELLSDPSKKTEAYPNIRIIHVPEIILKGMILMWYGQEDIPKGWHICDGTKGTPNLIDRFIKASDSVGEVNPENVDEENKLVLKEENLPEHHHPHKPHTHKISELSGSTEDSGSLSMSLNYNDYNWGVSSNTTRVISSVSGEGISSASTSVVSSVTAHTQGGSASGGNHTHDVTITGGDIYETTSEEQEWQYGEIQPIKLEPRHYKLIFIMKIDGDEQ